MSTFTENASPVSDDFGEQEPFEPTTYTLSTSRGTGTRDTAQWAVTVRPDGHKIARDICFERRPWDPAAQGWEPEGIIWPTWPADSEDITATAGSPLAEVQDYWTTVANRLRDSAKWMALVIGASLGTVVGATPLAGIRQHPLAGIAITLGLVGLGLLGLTLYLVMQVMRPQSVSYSDVQSATPGWRPFRNPLDRWRETVESQEDLYLPCGIKCMTSLRQSMIIEEVTLMSLARARASAVDEPTSRRLCEAQAARDLDHRWIPSRAASDLGMRCCVIVAQGSDLEPAVAQIHPAVVHPHCPASGDGQETGKRPGDAWFGRAGQGRPGDGHLLLNRSVVVPDQRVTLVFIQAEPVGQPRGRVTFQPGQGLPVPGPAQAVQRKVVVPPGQRPPRSLVQFGDRKGRPVQAPGRGKRRKTDRRLPGGRADAG